MPLRLASVVGLVLIGAISRAVADGPCPPRPPAPAPCPPAAPSPAPEPASQPPPAPAQDSPFEGPADNALLGLRLGLRPEPPPQQRKDLSPDESAAARSRSAELRAALPTPAEPWTFERTLVFNWYRLGQVTITAEPAELGGKPVWFVTERTERAAGEGRVVSEAVLYLAPDLSLIRGETVLRAPAGTEAFSFGRREGRMEVTAESDGKTQTVEADVPADATSGLFALVRFAEASAHHTLAGRPCLLPVFDPRHAFPDDAGKPIPSGQADLQLERAVRTSSGGFTEHAPRHEVLATSLSGRSSILALDSHRDSVGTIRGHFPHWSLYQGAGGWRRCDWFDRIGDTPQTACQALCTFGRGYHLAKPELLEQAFHWPSMHAHELATRTIEPDVSLERMKAAYIQEFLDRSKHRTAGDCDDLLTQILVTSEITTGEDGSVSIKALPVYGGHTFHCAVKDGRWWIVAVD